MAPISSSTFHDHERLDFESIQALLISVNKQILILLNDEQARKSLQLKCISKLKFQTQKFFEFSEQCVLSNLYWGIENVEASIQVKFLEERASRLKDSERMLQVSALIDENGSTAGIPNRFLICCSYFYLSLVRKLQRDEWQVTLYFLQALLVYPRLVRMEFAPEICGSLFLSQIMVGSQNTSGTRGSSPQYLFDFCEDGTDEAMWQLARRYKDWLIYYQVLLYGEARQGHWGCGVASSIDEESPSLKYQKSIRNRYLSSVKLGNGWLISQNFDTMHPLDPDESIMDKVADWPKAFMVNQKQKHVILEAINMDDVCIGYQKERVGIKCLQDMIQEPESDNPASVYLENHSEEGSDLVATEDSGNSVSVLMTNADELKPEFDDRQLQAPCSISIPEYVEETPFNSPGLPIHKEAQEMETDYFCSRRFLGPKIDPNLSIVELGDINSNKFCQCCTGEEAIRRSQCGFRLIDYLSSSSSLKNFSFEMDHQRGSAREKFNSLSLRKEGLHPESETLLILEIFENAIATLCFSEGLLKCEENEKLKVSTMREMVNNKEGAKYSLLKDIILGQLTDAITNSKDDKVIRSSVSILSAMIIENRSIIEDAMKKGLCLSDLATALKRNVHEAAILIYLINPSPTEIVSLELLPKLLDIICNSSSDKERTASSLLLTPPAASLMIIKVLVTSFDYSTNVKHLDAISSPKVLSRLVNVAINGHQEEFASLAAILTKCMQLNGKCRKFLSKFIPLAPFILLLRSEEKCAKFIAIEFFHEFLHMPRTSAINILHQIRQQGSINIMSALISCIHQSQQVYQILAANLLLQLDMLEDSCGESTYREEAIDVLLKSIASSKSSATQILSASIVSNLGGTYSWTGEPYTAAWLLKRACLTSIYHRNMVRNFDWLEKSLQDDGIGAWCRKIARGIIGVGTSVFYALEKGLKSKIKSVSRDCLTTIAWLGYEIAMSPSNLRYSACEILLSGIEQFLHPGLELDERFLACLCVYSYASGKGMQKLIHFSEGVRESLRRLSNITWMAGELLNVADYILPNKSRVSCVHTQILEANQNRSGAACALIFYKGQLYSGYSDGSIKAWDIKGQAFSLVWDIKEHKKAVTCFALYEPGDSLLSGSTDKTIRVWRMVLGKLECVEVIEANETIHKIDTIGKMILVVAQSRGIKVFDASREVKVICRDKHVKCTTVVQRKIYVGCTDSSIQEIDITRNREREIRSPSRSWRMCCRPINSVIVYKDWVYVASSIIEGSSLKDWRRFNKPQMSLTTGKGKNVLEMGVVEDFIYLNCSSLPGILQIWLRGTQRKVGRLSAGSRITSILTANDIVFCGTEMGLIKGWIPL